MYALAANSLVNVANREANYGDRESNIKTEKNANHCFHFGMLTEQHVFSVMGEVERL